MFDAKLRPVIDPPLNAAARQLVRLGVSANMLTIAGALIGLGAAAAIALQYYTAGLLLVAANRLLDGLDGPVARIKGPSEFGGYLDSLADFLFYVSVPAAFGIANPANALPALFLVSSFTITAVSFLAFAAVAARAGANDGAHGKKAFIYSTGLMEGAETIAFFIAMCLFPLWFPALAWIFTALCVATVLQRIAMARRQFD
ncbi:CDP-alcohol phosphatidyltransferase family protein [Sphingorhabdus arenilitoris]|uniref:CDP-alcohol phosphatidyltransferase family protein n=1 Tax=Sphingorhabdus arenilitoris TaxID=1490041 RepID=A0ABV8REG7_9SPHN